MRIPPDIEENLAAVQPLRDYAGETGLFLDLDGTLCELVDLPEKVQFHQATRDLLQALQTRFASVVIISGRSARSLESIVQIPELTYVGNHGFEVLEQGKRRVLLPEPHASRMRAIEEMLPDAIDVEGAALELKELSHAIHYRGALNPRKARKDILRALGRLHLRDVRILEGKFLIQVRPDAGLDKGTAVTTLVQERGLRVLLYAGDDTTDIDGFRAILNLGAQGDRVGIRLAVSYPDTPAALLAAADFVVPGVEGMHEMMEWMVS
ncbi:MAG: trehalose-phosphatase [Thermoplasmata archaeon]